MHEPTARPGRFAAQRHPPDAPASGRGAAAGRSPVAACSPRVRPSGGTPGDAALRAVPPSDRPPSERHVERRRQLVRSVVRMYAQRPRRRSARQSRRARHAYVPAGDRPATRLYELFPRQIVRPASATSNDVANSCVPSSVCTPSGRGGGGVLRGRGGDVRHGRGRGDAGPPRAAPLPCPQSLAA